MAMWSYGDLSPACYEPYPSFSLFLFTLEMLAILPQAFLVICLVSFFIVFSPCIFYTLCKYIMDERARTRVKRQVVDSLGKITFGKINLEGQEACAICLVEFEEHHVVTPLSCDIKHYFHHECIKNWMKVKNECPLCKAKIEPQNLTEFTKRLKEKEQALSH